MKTQTMTGFELGGEGFDSCKPAPLLSFGGLFCNLHSPLAGEGARRAGEGLLCRHSEKPENQAGLLRRFSDYSESQTRGSSTMRLRLGGRNDGGIHSSLPLREREKNAFTLAEVLITLGIIGVVAALTLPALTQNYKKQQAITSVKKAYSLMNQSVKLAVVDNGSPSSWVEIDAPVSYSTSLNYFNKYIKPYYKVAKICTGETNYLSNDYEVCGYKSPYSTRIGGWKNGDLWNQNGNRVIFATPDGMVFFIYPYETFCSQRDDSTPDDPKYDCSAKSTGTQTIEIDINGPKEPNTWGKDLFRFALNPEKEVILPSGYDSSDEDINEDCNKEEYEGGFKCAAKLMKDGWQMKKDYPW